MLKSLSLSFALLLFAAATGYPQWNSSRPDGYGPTGVSLDHTHETGELMLSYHYMYMKQNGLRDGTTNIKFGEAIDPRGGGFLTTPTDLSIRTHMFGVSFAPISRLTIVGTLPVRQASMDNFTRNGRRFTTESSGLGDVTVAGLWLLDPVGDQRAHISMEVGLPTGSIARRDVTPLSAGREFTLPYPMQTSGGTVDLSPGLTLLGQVADVWSWGGQAQAQFRLGKNDYYSLGDNYTATAWGARRLNDWLSGSFRLDWFQWGAIEGADPSQNPLATPASDPNLQGGSRWSAGLGINTYFSEGSLKGFRVSGEWMVPLYQDLDGPQLETDWIIIIGAEYDGVSKLLKR